MSKLRLPNVTLCCIGSGKYKDSQQKMLDYCAEKVDFGAVKNIIVDTNTIDEWNKAVIFDLGDHIDTDFCLLVHPDGGIGNQFAWDDEWLKYDYIGSPWPLPTDDYSYRDIHGTIQRVGNSVSLRSKKLLQLPKRIGMEWKAFHGLTNEDGYICVNMRHRFTAHGCKFAPYEEAVKFGIEHEMPEHKLHVDPFVYHKNFNFISNQYPNYEQAEN